MHKTIDPTILYFGTPVALISTLNLDGSPNLAPMSSAWWLGWSCILGLGQMGQTSDNLIRTPKYVFWAAGGRSPVTGYYSNHVVAYVRSMSGAAYEKYPQSNPDVQDLAFSYRMTSEVVPY